jgi:cytosine/adenosine deaminase-related metal-dependent hydrolase
VNRLAVRPVEVSAGSRIPSGTLRLTGARVARDPQTAVPAEVVIEDGIIRQLHLESANSRSVPKAHSAATTADLTGYLLLPGLINAHDHLEFNLFPRLGKGPYANFRDWAEDIFRPDVSPVREHLAVPKPVRLWWGAIKNLLCGVTTVCHHNPYDRAVSGEDFPVRVVRHYGWAHSLALDKDVAARFRATPHDAPFLIHLGEGTDAASAQEVFELDRQGALDARTAIIHAVGLDGPGRALVEARGAGVVWCPSSNLFTLGKTLGRDDLRRHRRVALGSDSALSAQGDLLDEIQLARSAIAVGSEELYRMVTDGAAEILWLDKSVGSLQFGRAGDLIAVPDGGQSPADTLAVSSFRDVELVIVGGRPHLLSDEMLSRFTATTCENLHGIEIDATRRWIRAPLARLLEETARHLPLPVRLAGRSVRSL